MKSKKQPVKAAKQQKSETDARKTRGRTRPDVQFPAAPPAAELPSDYADLLSDLKTCIKRERLRVVLASNAALVLMYWDIGHRILQKQTAQGWGARIIDRLSADLRKAFPDMSGFSPRNLKYMRAFAATWPDREIVQAPLAQLTWYHNIALLEKLNAPEERLWYAAKSLEHGWSRNILTLQIEAKAYRRAGKAQNNFPATMPPQGSDMAVQIFKDPYLFDFLGTADTRREAELEPGDTAQLNIYMNVVDELLRHPDDQPTIGLLLVKQKNRVLVEYALAGYRKPMSVAEWETKLTHSLPEELKGSLPTIEEIEAELGGGVREWRVLRSIENGRKSDSTGA